MAETWSVEADSCLESSVMKAFAWEFLRRNSEYQAAYRSIASGGDAASVTQRWGCAVDPDLRADRTTLEKLQIAKVSH
jgi:Family of unknown function (DUF6499)